VVARAAERWQHHSQDKAAHLKYWLGSDLPVVLLQHTEVFHNRDGLREIEKTARVFLAQQCLYTCGSERLILPAQELSKREPAIGGGSAARGDNTSGKGVTSCILIWLTPHAKRLRSCC
jgi:hypothetical protein